MREGKRVEVKVEMAMAMEEEEEEEGEELESARVLLPLASSRVQRSEMRQRRLR